MNSFRLYAGAERAVNGFPREGDGSWTTGSPYGMLVEEGHMDYAERTMYFRCSNKRSDGKIYRSVQLVRSAQHPETKRPTTRVIASMGDLVRLPERQRVSLVLSFARILGVGHRFKPVSKQPTLFDERPERRKR